MLQVTPNIREITTHDELLAAYTAELMQFTSQIITRDILLQIQSIHKKYIELQDKLGSHCYELDCLVLPVNNNFLILYKDGIYTPLKMLNIGDMIPRKYFENKD